MTELIADQAIQLATPSIRAALSGTAKRYAGHLRVSYRLDGRWAPAETADFGDRFKWEHDYERYATSKEEISQRTGKSTREVQYLHPEQLEPGDTIYFGSVVSDDGNIVVAFSGFEAYFDEMFAKWVLAICLALIEHSLSLVKTEEGFYN
jgi:hypothetical protein